MKLNKLYLLGIASSLLGVVLVVSSLGINKYREHTFKEQYDMNFIKSDVSKAESVAFSDVDLSSDMVVDEVKDYKSVIEIPSLNIVSPITEGVGSNMEYSVGHFPNTPKLGENGNICLAGHSSEMYDCVFNDLHNIEVGESINIYDETGNLQVYTVVKSRTISPDSIGVLNDYKDNRLTIITCTAKGTRRLLITAKILSAEEKVKLLSKVYNSSISDVNDTVRTFKISIQEVVNLTDFLDESRPYSHSDILIQSSTPYKYQDNMFRKLR